MRTFRLFFYRSPQNILAIFSGTNLLWHALDILLTVFLVESGFDWLYFTSTRYAFIVPFALPAAALGFLVPVLLPFFLIAIGSLQRQRKVTLVGLAVGQAAVFGWAVSSFYKAFTGRAHPMLFGGNPSDISHVFHFGFLRGGIFWGWPSSHTAVAFAVAMTLVVLVKKRGVRTLALLAAVYIGLGVSLSIHWFSDFAAGAMIGSVIGVVVGNSFKGMPISRLE